RLRRLQHFRSSKLHHELVDVAPAPILPGLERSHDRMFGRTIMLGGVLVLRIVATSDMSAGSTQTKMHPFVSGGEAFFAAGGIRHGRHYRLQMRALGGHRNTPPRLDALLCQRRIDRVKQKTQAERHVLNLAVDEESRRAANTALAATLNLFPNPLQIGVIVHLGSEPSQ